MLSPVFRPCLSGNIPSEIGLLDKLQMLSLSSNKLQGENRCYLVYCDKFPNVLFFFPSMKFEIDVSDALPLPASNLPVELHSNDDIKYM